MKPPFRVTPSGENRWPWEIVDGRGEVFARVDDEAHAEMVSDALNVFQHVIGIQAIVKSRGRG